VIADLDDRHRRYLSYTLAYACPVCGAEPEDECGEDGEVAATDRGILHHKRLELGAADLDAESVFP
jgi:hypothetical protein